MNYFNKSKEELLNIFNVNEKEGLSEDKISELEKKYGKNELKEAENRSIISVFLEQFKDFLVVILLIAAAISFVSGNRESTLVILVVLIMNAILGTIQFFKAQKSLESLRKISTPKAKVVRDGKKKEINSIELVPGDIVLLEAGDVVPADSRVLNSYSLMVNESSLTGESESVEKHNRTIVEKELAVGDQTNMVFSGSLVTYGRAEVLVTSIGMSTELGKIAQLLNKTESEMTPLQKSLENFGKKLSLAIIILCGIVFIVNIYRGINLLQSLMFAVALAVAAIPEALGSIVTIVLAIGTQKMAKENAIVKELHSVESLGSIGVICSDKTGTLTQNKMTVKKIFVDFELKESEYINIESESERTLIENSILCCDAIVDKELGKELGDPTEIALVNLANKNGIEEKELRLRYKRESELPFDSERKMMSTLHTKNNRKIMVTKGAPDILLNKVKYLLKDGKVESISDDEKKKIIDSNNEMAEDGLRVLAVVEKHINSNYLEFKDENDFIFVGLIGMIDPPREESKEAVKNCIRAGIKPVMITGDHKVTAVAIAKEIGIYKTGNESITGIELERMSDDELDKRIENISVFARVSPEHKIRIVNAWQKKGKICAMTGDGVNDAPALKKADVGIAMGITGTEVSKDAASLILMDDNFSTIVKSIVTGRNLYKNIKNSIRFLLSGNAAGIFSVFYVSIMSLPMIFEPVHLLFINLLTDSLPAVAIGMEPAHNDVLDEKPRDIDSPLLSSNLSSRIIVEGILIAIVTIIAFYLGLKENKKFLESTMAFATLCLARLFHGFNCRGNGSIIKFGFLSNIASVYAFIIGCIFLYSVLLIPKLHVLFSIGEISKENFIEINILAFIPTLIIQIIKHIKYRNK